MRKKNRQEHKKKDINTFIKEASIIHNNKYDYSKVNYINAHTKIVIICPEHGEFLQTPNRHLKGQGCPKCSYLHSGEYQKSNTDIFVKKSIQIHGNKYDYSKVEYVNNRKKIYIICPEHGVFLQKPLDHLHGCGRPECGKRFNLTERKILLSLKDIFGNVIYQYSPLWLHGKTSPQSIDFFLPDYNIAIEYQGRQHFTPIEIFGGIDALEKTRERDIRKYQKCKDNGIKIFYLSYERNLPENYFAPIFKTFNELIKEINKEIIK